MTIGNGALYPGAGVQKDLPPVGDIHITGIVNICGHMEQTALQTTRLSTVISLGDIIVGGIEAFLQESEIREKPSPAYKFPRRPVRIFPEALLPGRIRQTHR